MDAGWYSDPNGLPVQRYWDGATWTEQIRDAPDYTSSAPHRSSSPPPIEPTAGPAGPKPRRWTALATVILFVALAAVLVLLPNNKTIYGGTNHPYPVHCGNAISAAGISESTVLTHFYQYGIDKVGLGPGGNNANPVDAQNYNIVPSDYHEQVKRAASSCNSTGQTKIFVGLGLVIVGVLAAFGVRTIERRRV